MRLFSLHAGRPEHVPRRLLAFITDMAGFTLCGLLAFELRFDGCNPRLLCTQSTGAHKMGGSQVGCSSLEGSTPVTGAIPRSIKPYGWVSKHRRVDGGRASSSLAVHPGIPRSIYIMEWMASCTLTLGTRFAVR